MKIANEAMPGAFDIEKEAALGDSVDTCKDRLRRVFDYNYENMHVARILDENFNENPDEKACITYVSLLYQAMEANRRSAALRAFIRRAIKMERIEKEAAAKVDELKQLIAQGS